MTSTARTTPSHAKSSWFATAAQKVRATSGHPRSGSLVPWGVVHGRRLGSARTACGVACFTWPIFFDLDVRYERESDVCPDCRRIALLDRPAVEW
jgi:hypothetical protein